MRTLLLSLFLATTSCLAVFAQEETSETNSGKQTSVSSGNCTDHPVLNDVRLNVLDDRVFIGNRKASGREILNMMRVVSPELYQKRSSGKNLMIGGIVTAGVGGGLLLCGGFCMLVSHLDDEYYDDDYDYSYRDEDYRDSDLWEAGVALASVGAAGVVVGVPLSIIGVKKKRKALSDFKQNCLGEESFHLENQPQYQLNLNVKQNGLGVALVF